MLDTIIYIPTILAYFFIFLLLVIIMFIVVYIGHKMFISVYDNLPASSQSLAAMKQTRDRKTRSGKMKYYNSNASSVHFDSSSQFLRKSKTAMRITMVIEPCYMAYVILACGKHTTTLTIDWNTSNSKLIKYFRRLDDIPIEYMANVMQICPQVANDLVDQTEVTNDERRIEDEGIVSLRTLLFREMLRTKQNQ